jgi:hypothetical protein
MQTGKGKYRGILRRIPAAGYNIPLIIKKRKTIRLDFPAKCTEDMEDQFIV